MYKVLVVLDSIKFQETVFALPFAFTGMILAADGLPTLSQLIWITVAMVTARSLGMSANRIIDRHIDARNPRTSNRHLPKGILRVFDMKVMAVVSCIIFVISAAMLNTLALILAPFAACFLVIYPYTKRFTWLSNLLLGCALAIAPSAAWIGVTGGLSWEPVLLSVAVAFWAGSFDILYHVQDYRYYVDNRLHSVAQRFGVIVAFRLAQIFDVFAVTSLVVVGTWLDLSYPFYIGSLVVAFLMAYKYVLVSPRDFSNMNMAFFRVNALVSTVVFLSTVASLLVTEIEW
jgi:4-hydroxybenzoate polyprenyltransferase